jgi:hypothetical protein
MIDRGYFEAGYNMFFHCDEPSSRRVVLLMP